MIDKDVKAAVVLMNLGSPDSTSTADVRRYLREFLMDKRVIDIPYISRWLLVNGIIANFRAPKSAEAYKSIWTKDGSPLIIYTEQLKDQVQKQVDIPVRIAMRYGSFSPRSTFDELQESYPNLERVLLVPMYPHYAMSSYETALVYAEETHKANNYSFQLDSIKPYYDNNDYINALTNSILSHLNKEYDHILFSYHGVPERHIIKGDITGSHCLKTNDCCSTNSEAHKQCYRHQCYKTTELVAEKLGLSNDKYSQSFQSRLGRSEWLKPYTAVRFEEMPNEGIKKLLVVCPAFISDCLETLEEIAEEGKETFMKAGGESFEMIPCLNIHPEWVNTLSNWTQEYVQGKSKMLNS